MARKPNRASGYATDQVEHVRATCLYVATKLGDLADETVIVGGLVPSLLIDQNEVGGAEGRHVGPGAYVILKALTFKNRGENKDAYDLFCLLRHFGAGIDDVVARLVPLLDDAEAKEAITVLEKDFSDLDGVGPRRVAEFLRGARDEDLQADVRGLVLDLVARCRAAER